ncbi:MAG: hypothetical protein E7269_00620 [Lachnospiraceae bacterium]|nr:hypothetical protein [Lachnospiraceae bacterium]
MANKLIKENNKEKRRLQARRERTLGVGILVVILAVLVFLLGKCSADKKNGEGETNGINPNQGEVSTGEKTTPGDIEIPGEGKLDISGVLGFVAQENMELPKLSDANLCIEAVGGYNGLFVEDGSNESIHNVLSLIVTNNSEQTLQIARITLSDGEITYSFQITTLPAGASVLVLEQNKEMFTASKEYVVTDLSSGYFSSDSLMEDELTITGEDGKIIVENIGEKTYSKLYVYYKLMKRGGVYMGGITYRTPIENLAPGESKEAVAAHYREASGHIIMVEAAE